MSRFPSNVRFEYLEAHHSNWTRGTWDKQYIVAHWWDEPARRPTFDGVVSWFRNPTANVSIQYMVEANRITQMIPESAMAWHSGNNNSNRHGIGIEVNPRLNAGDYETTAVLVAEIERRLGRRMPLRRHREVNRSTACPGHMDVARIRRRADQIKSGATPAPSTPTAPPLEGDIMSPREFWSYLNKSVDERQVYRILRDTDANARDVQRRIRRADWRTWVANGVSGFRSAPLASLSNRWNLREDGYRLRSWVQYAYLWGRRAHDMAQQGRNEAREHHAENQAGISALADQLDSLKPGLAQAVKDAMAEGREEQVRITAAEVAAELEAETQIGVKEDDDQEED